MQRIIALRDARGWTKSVLARAAGIVPNYQSRLENGTRPVTLTYLQKASDALDTDVVTLLGVALDPMLGNGLPIDGAIAPDSRVSSATVIRLVWPDATITASTPPPRIHQDGATATWFAVRSELTTETIQAGDVLLFDSARQPAHGDLVIVTHAELAELRSYRHVEDMLIVRPLEGCPGKPEFAGDAWRVIAVCTGLRREL